MNDPLIKIKYQYHNNCHKFVINGDYIKSDVIRSEGSVQMRIKNDELLIFSKNDILHDDHKALISILGFFPVLPKKCNLIFDFDVSEYFLKEIRKIRFFEYVNILSLNKNESSYNNDNTCICFGGGNDSSAISVLFPNIKKIQQINMIENDFSKDDNLLMIKSNIRELYTKWGLPVWVSIFIIPIIENYKYILTGTQYNSLYLNNGYGYKKLFNNEWYRFFKKININILSVACVSEITTAELVIKGNLENETEFCYFSSRKRCHSCTKCLRKYLEMSLFNDKFIENVNNFDLSTEIFEQYFNNEQLYFGDCLKYSIDILHDRYPKNKNISILKNKINKFEISDVSFLNKYYYNSFDDIIFPDDLKDNIIKKLNYYNILPMCDSDISKMKKFSNKKIK